MQKVYSLLTLVILFPVFFSACASENEEAEVAKNSPAIIRLVLPPEESEEDFWRGVETRDFIWLPNNATTSFRLPLTGGGDGIDFSTGGELRFEGKSALGAALVVGAVRFGPWNPAQVNERLILIPLLRR